MSHRDWDLGELRAMWERRRAAVERAKEGVDPTGMTRPPRDPAKREWLERYGDPGPFVEAPSLAEQLERIQPELDRVLRELDGALPKEWTFQWLVRANPHLGDRSPLEALLQGDTEAVVRAAEVYRSGSSA